jgi:putative Ca2+/H+ antiporter (TMEM165/GDT1 family)
MLVILFATYGAVFVAEIVGDKLLYTTGVLATRYRPAPIMLGMAIAFMAKMGVAVAVGQAISHLPRLLVAAITTLSFCGVAWTLWKKPVAPAGTVDDHTTGRAAAVSFAAIFFSEWGDVGQITAATMAARFASPLVVWLGAVGAMVTKGILAASLGAGLRRGIQRRLSPRVIQLAGVAMLLVLGLLSVLETLLERPG